MIGNGVSPSFIGFINKSLVATEVAEAMGEPTSPLPPTINPPGTNVIGFISKSAVQQEVNEALTKKVITIPIQPGTIVPAIPTPPPGWSQSTSKVNPMMDRIIKSTPYILGVVALSVGGWFAYKYFTKKKKVI